MWQALNTETMKKVWVIPSFFGLQQTLAGTKLAMACTLAPYGSWDYVQIYAMDQ